MRQNIQERIAQLQKEQEQLKAKAQKLQNQFNATERKTNDRRKYVAGALLLKNIETNKGLHDYFVKLLSNSPEQTKKIFPDLVSVSSAIASDLPKS